MYRRNIEVKYAEWLYIEYEAEAFHRVNEHECYRML